MYPYRGIVCTYIRSEGLSTRPNQQNTLTRKSTSKNDSPREPLQGPVTMDKRGVDNDMGKFEGVIKIVE